MSTQRIVVGSIWRRKRDRREGGGLSDITVEVTAVHRFGPAVVRWSLHSKPRRGQRTTGQCSMSTFATNYVPETDQ